MFFEEQNSERRKFPRVNFREPVKFQMPDCSLSGGCLARDISEGGLRINFEHFIKPQAPMTVEFRLFPKEEPICLEGHVAWVSQIPLSDRYQLGIEFARKNDENQQNIRQYVTSHQLV